MVEFEQVLKVLAEGLIPLLILAIPCWGFLKKVPVYEVFVEGAAEGFQTSLRIMPYLVAMLTALAVFRESGAMTLLEQLVSPILTFLGVPQELLPLAVMRPLSGSGSMAITLEMLEIHGPDSYLGQVASVIAGSTDTTFYILTVYFGAVGIQKARYAPIVGLTGDLVALFAAVYLCQILSL